MMRNIYPTSSRSPYAYPTHNAVNSMSRYPQMNSTYPSMAQFSGMPGSMGGMSGSNISNMSSMTQQMQRFPMTSDYNVNLVRVIVTS